MEIQNLSVQNAAVLEVKERGYEFDVLLGGLGAPESFSAELESSDEVGGGEIEDIPVGEVQAGDSTTVPIEVACEGGQPVEVVCEITATLSGSPDCMETARVEGRVVCLVPVIRAAGHKIC